MFKKIIFIAVIVLIIPLTINGVKKNQENRSKANEETSTKINNPYTTGQDKAYKGQLHTHSNKSDGEKSVKEVIQAYKDKKYDFVAITDHGKFTNTDSYNEPDKFITLAAKEITKIGGFHLRDINQVKLDANNSFFTINHPGDREDVKTRWPENALNKEKNRVNALEICNNCADNKEKKIYSREFFWDELLSKGWRIWAVSADDSHFRSGDDRTFNHYIKVFSPKNNRQEIFKNIKNGNYYSVATYKNEDDINLKISLEEKNITVTTDIGSTIYFISNNTDIGSTSVNKIQKNTKNSQTLSYQIKGNEKYIRVNVINSKGKAWSNPIFIESSTPTPTEIQKITPTIKLLNSDNNTNLKNCGKKIEKTNDGCNQCGGECIKTLKKNGECQLSSGDQGTIKSGLCLHPNNFVGYRCCIPNNIPGIILPGDKKCQDQGGLCIKTAKTSGECEINPNQRGEIKTGLCLSDLHNEGYRCCIPKK